VTATRRQRRRRVRAALLGALGALGARALAASGATFAAGAARAARRIEAVGAENQYASVIAQIGGPYVAVSSIESNPNTDPHTFEVSPSAARLVANAALVVQNGLGYDAFMTKIEASSPSARRKVIVAQAVCHLPNNTANPHLWYSPATMPAVARVVANDLSALEPSHRAYFAARVRAFDDSLRPWLAAIARLKARFHGAAVASTEPVADDLLQAAGLRNRTPWTFQADVMNGVDPAPEAVSLVERLFSSHEVKALVYNEQVTDPLTSSLRGLARAQHIPIVGVYETMPTPGYTYATWMLAEVSALTRALADRQSTTRL